MNSWHFPNSQAGSTPGMMSAWDVLEAIDAKSMISFLTIYMVESAPALLLVAIFSSNYLQLILDLLVIYTIIILPSLFLLGRLVSRRDVMNRLNMSHTGWHCFGSCLC
jgi:manganese transport protein